MSPLQGEAKLAYMRQYYRESAEKIKEYQKCYRKANREKLREKRRARYYANREEALTQVKHWTLENLERKRAYMREYGKAYRVVNKERIWAQGLARQVPLGPACEKCGSVENLEKHHPDYSKPLEVMTLCRSSHMKLHRGVIGA